TATGRISFSAKAWTQSRISRCSSLSSNETMWLLAPVLERFSTRTYRSCPRPYAAVRHGVNSSGGGCWGRFNRFAKRTPNEPEGVGEQEGGEQPGQDAFR